MNVLSVKFLKEGEPAAYPGVEKLHHQAGGFDALVLENGMASGKPAVAFVGKTADNRLVILETSAEQVVALAKMIQARHPEVGA